MTSHGLDPDLDDDMFELWSQFQQNATARLRKAAPTVTNVTLWTSTLTSTPDLAAKIPSRGHIIQIWTDSLDKIIPRILEQNYSVGQVNL